MTTIHTFIKYLTKIPILGTALALILLPVMTIPAAAAVSTCTYTLGAHDYNANIDTEFDFKLNIDDTIHWAQFTPPAGTTISEGSPDYAQFPFTLTPSNTNFFFYIDANSSTTQTNAQWDVQVSSDPSGANPITCTSSDTFNAYIMQLQVNGTSTSPEVTWDAIPGALNYTLTRNGEQIQDTSDTSFTDSGLTVGDTYDYAVVAHLGNNDIVDAEIQVNPLQDTLYTPTEL